MCLVVVLGFDVGFGLFWMLDCWFYLVGVWVGFACWLVVGDLCLLFDCWLCLSLI